MDNATWLDKVDTAIAVIGHIAKLVPEIGDWLAMVTNGQNDPIAQRVREVLPEASKSRAAAIILGAE